MSNNGMTTGKIPVDYHFYLRQLQYAQKRVAELEQALVKANAQAEHFEREWYLRGDKIEDLETAVQSEREACAEICDEFAEYSMNPYNFAENCAQRIRARGK
jgi:predicted  nucleic acid-binding Zn-ribbon protein